MSETTEKSKSSKLSLSRPGKLELKKTVESGAVRQNFSHGRSKMVQVERKTKRTFALDSGGHMAEVKAPKIAEVVEEVAEEVTVEAPPPPSIDEENLVRSLTEEEKAARQRALEEAKKYEEERREVAERDAARREAVKVAEEAEVALEAEAKTVEEAVAEAEQAESAPDPVVEAPAPVKEIPKSRARTGRQDETEEEDARGRGKKQVRGERRPTPPSRHSPLHRSR